MRIAVERIVSAANPGARSRSSRLARWLGGTAALLLATGAAEAQQPSPPATQVAVQGQPGAAASTALTIRLDAMGALASGAPLALRLSRALEATDGRLAIVIAGTDVSALVERGVDRVTVRPSPAFRIPPGSLEVAVYLVKDGAWTEVARLPLEVRTTHGFSKAELRPSIALGSRGQLAEGHGPVDAAPERPRYQDATLNGGLVTAHGRGGWLLSTQSTYLGVTNERERLRFGDRGALAPRLDLADYKVELKRGRAALGMGTQSIGINPYLASGFASRGVSLGLGGPVTLALSAVGGTNVVGWDNLTGLTEPRHRIGTASLGVELVPARPGAMHLDVMYLDGSLLPRSSATQGAVTDAERSRGGGLQLSASTPSQRLRVAGGWARSRFDNPTDSLLARGADLVPVRAESRDARFAELGVGLLQNARLRRLPALNLAATARHERVDPNYRSVAGATQADVQRSALDLTGAFGALAAQGSFTRSNDNLARVASILRTYTRTGAGTLTLPVAAALGRTAGAAWWPTLSAAHAATHQWGAGVPIEGDFAATHVPDQASVVSSASAGWSAGRVRAAARFERSAQDNRQVGRALADLDGAAATLTLGGTPASTLDLALDLTDERQHNHELSQRSRVRRLGVTADWRPWAATTLGGGVTLNRTADEPRTNEATTTDVRAEVTQAVALRPGALRTDAKGGRGQLFLRYSRQAVRTLRVGDPARLDLALAPRDVRDLWTLASGLTLTLF